MTAFEQGHYGIVRKRAPEIAKLTQNPEVASAALMLRARIDADPLAIRLLIGALILLVVLTAWVYLAHPH